LEFAIALLLVVGLIAFAVAQTRLPRRRDIADDDADARTLASLSRAGADLTRETLVTFHVYFATEEAADDVAAVLSDEGYQGAVQASADGSTWHCSLARRMTPTPEAIRLAASRVSDVARPLGGVYDGWEVAAARGIRA
jgi:hypothetical protein